MLALSFWATYITVSWIISCVNDFKNLLISYGNVTSTKSVGCLCMYLVSEVGNICMKFQWEGNGHEAVVTYLTVNYYTMP